VAYLGGGVRRRRGRGAQRRRRWRAQRRRRGSSRGDRGRRAGGEGMCAIPRPPAVLLKASGGAMNGETPMGFP
jgi:hypothetical protein